MPAFLCKFQGQPMEEGWVVHADTPALAARSLFESRMPSTQEVTIEVLTLDHEPVETYVITPR